MRQASIPTPEVQTMNTTDRTRLETLFDRTAADLDYAVRTEMHSEAARLARQLTRIGNKIGR